MDLLRRKEGDKGSPAAPPGPVLDGPLSTSRTLDRISSDEL